MKKTIIASLLLVYSTGGILSVQAAYQDWVTADNTLNSGEAWLTQNDHTEQVKANTSADPTINLNTEREGKENKLGIGLSIPLPIRNNNHDILGAASQEIAVYNSWLDWIGVSGQPEAYLSAQLPRSLVSNHFSSLRNTSSTKYSFRWGRTL
ncbi:MAG: hypothetical protein V5788_07395 [Shewanella sp.]